MSIKTWNGATASIDTAADWRQSGMPGAGDVGIVAAGTVLADGMALDGFTLRLTGSNAPTLEMAGTSLGPKFHLTVLPGTAATLDVNGRDSNAGQIVVGSPSAPATLQIQLGSRTDELDNTGQIVAEPGSTIGITAGQVVNNGRLIANGGNIVLNTQLTGVGTVLIEANGTVAAQQIVGSGQTVLMHGGTLALGSADNFLAILQGWDSGSVLELAHTQLTSADVSGGILSLHDGGFLEAQIHLSGHYSSADFHIANQADGSSLVTTTHLGAWS
jgi:hypothetical protein